MCLESKVSRVKERDLRVLDVTLESLRACGEEERNTSCLAPSRLSRWSIAQRRAQEPVALAVDVFMLILRSSVWITARRSRLHQVTNYTRCSEPNPLDEGIGLVSVQVSLRSKGMASTRYQGLMDRRALGEHPYVGRGDGLGPESQTNGDTLLCADTPDAANTHRRRPA